MLVDFVFMIGGAMVFWVVLVCTVGFGNCLTDLIVVNSVVVI